MAVNTTFEVLGPTYTHLWETCTILPSRKSAADATAAKIIANMPRYREVEKATTVPAAIIGIIHAMECGLSFRQHLHNGDPLTARTVQVPRGRPKNGTPPFSWEESAIDALTMEGLDKVTDWTPERFCYTLESYNGWGYRRLGKPINSPYLWSGTNQYARGKYVKDGVYDPNAISGQSGAVAILKCAMLKNAEVAALFTPEPTTVALADYKDMPPIDPVVPPFVTPPSAAELGEVSAKASLLLRVRNWFTGLGLTGGGLSVESLLQPDGPTNNLLTMIEKHPGAVLALGSVFLIVTGVVAVVLLEYMKKDVANGRYLPSGWEQS